MTPELWQQVSSALDRLLDLAPAEQAQLLQQLRRDAPGICTEVESLLGQTPSDLLESLPPPLFDNLPTSSSDVSCANTLAYNTNAAGGDARRTTLRSAGRYVVQEEIDRGGMGAILRVLDPTFGRILAIKILLPQARLDPIAKRRFLQEAQITGCLQHPGIPPIHELGQLEDGTPFFAMKLIEGKTLAALIKEAGTTRIDARFVGIFEQICCTLAYTHSQGILHRDLKPSNVMVGAFGEVQVMDWGLAKPIAGHESIPESSHGNSLNIGQNNDSFSLAGDVMGTPAYMAPEQARGEVDRLDERCDVFGLGGILCAMLIGRPPFVGTFTHMVQQAADGDLAETFDLLDGCGADSDLLGIAKKCLAPNPADRYRSGAEVADAVTHHREGVQEKLTQAELARARAQVQAAEERRRRRITLSFSAVVLLMILAGGGAGFWYQAERQRLDKEQAQREVDEAKRQAELVTTREKVTREVTEALDSAEKSRVAYQRQLSDPLQAAKLIGDITLWETLLSDSQHAWKRANAVAAGNRPLLNFSLLADVDEMGAMLTADQQQFDVAKKLDEIRLDASVRVGGWFDKSRSGLQYANFFRDELGLDLKQGDSDKLAEKIRESPIRFALVATLDHWALSRESDPQLLAHLLETAGKADPDPTRNPLRDQELWRDRNAFQKQLESIDLASQPPPFLAAVFERLSLAGGDSISILRAAHVHHPRDFWLNLELGLKLSNSGEAIGYLQAALAVRRKSPIVYAALGNSLSGLGDYAGAVAAYRQAVQFDPAFADAYCNLGIALSAQGSLNDAATAFQTALDRAEYKNERLVGWICYNLGQTQSQLGEKELAVASYKNSVRFDPSLVRAHFEWGELLMGNDDPTGAVPILQMALSKMGEKDNGLAASAYFYLGAAHYRHKNYVGAIETYRQALQLAPARSDTYYELAKTLIAHRDFAGALEACQQGIDNLGSIDKFGSSGNPDSLVNRYTASVNRYTASLHFQMGKTLELQGRFNEALREWRTWQHLPLWPDAKGIAIKNCERRVEMDSQLAAVLQGQGEPLNATEFTEWAQHCLVYKKLPVAALQFYEKAFSLDPKLLPKLRYEAATAAVLAASSQGNDVDSLSETDKAKRRKQAHSWLNDQFVDSKSKLNLRPPADHVRGELRQWEQDSDLAFVREPRFLANLADAERQTWREFWEQIAEHGPGMLSPDTWESQHEKQGLTFWNNHTIRLFVNKESQGEAFVWNKVLIRGDFVAEAVFQIKPWKAKQDQLLYLRLFVTSPSGDRVRKYVMIDRHVRANKEGFGSNTFSPKGWGKGSFVANNELFGKLRIRRQGNEWTTDFRTNHDEPWIPLGRFELELPKEVRLGLNLGIEHGSLSSLPLDAVISRVTVTQSEDN